MKILSASQIRELDAFTIENEPIESIDLMERASQVFTNWFSEKFTPEENQILIFVGPGNNGGDGLAVARMLYYKFYDVKIFWCKIGNSTSPDFEKNLKRLPKRNVVPVEEINSNDSLPEIPKKAIIIDAIFGSGLNRPVEGSWAKLIHYLNQQSNTIVSIDIPSGLFADRHTGGVSIYANFTLSFELPKLSFFFPENHQSVGNWDFKSIGLDSNFIEKCKTSFFYSDPAVIKSILKKRKKFDHKGTFGHALLILGSFGKVGAAVLATSAALRSGAGLVTTHAPKCAYSILQSSTPEAMVSIDPEELYISEIPKLDPYKAIGIGCGIDSNQLTIKALKNLIDSSKVPVVFDADALNIISENQEWLSQLPKNSILTPHPKEFERLFGNTQNDFDRNELQRKKATELGVFIILKGAHTSIATPEGNCYFNATGNPGMATGGSGDVLTGLLTSLLAQGYSPEEAAVLGVYLHGLAADIEVQNTQSEESFLAGDLISNFGKAFKKIREY